MADSGKEWFRSDRYNVSDEDFDKYGLSAYVYQVTIDYDLKKYKDLYGIFAANMDTGMLKYLSKYRPRAIRAFFKACYDRDKISDIDGIQSR